jgi:pimeloyl-ACP methyl ester carboxylesterase
MAYAHGEKVERLVSINPNYRPGGEVLNTEAALAQPHDPEAGSPVMHRLHEQFQARLESRAVPGTEEEQRIAHKLTTLLQDHPNLTTAQLASIKAATLIMVGDYDVIPYEHTLEIFRAIPHAQLAVVPGSSHLFPIEKPDLTAQLISRFLTSPYYDVDPYYFLRP